jgi:hypothetical protein
MQNTKTEVANRKEIRKWKHKQEALGRSNRLLFFCYIFSICYDMESIENNASDSYSVAACVFTAAGTCLPSLCLPAAVSSGFNINWGTQTATWSHHPTFLFLNKESRLKSKTNKETNRRKDGNDSGNKLT